MGQSEISDCGFRIADLGLRRGARRRGSRSNRSNRKRPPARRGLRPGGSLLLQDIVKLKLHAACCKLTADKTGQKIFLARPLHFYFSPYC